MTSRLEAVRFGRQGGKASAAAMSPEQRQERARAAIARRWKGKRSMPIDQKAVLARLKNAEGELVLRIAAGAGGARRRAAIMALSRKGLICIRADAPGSMTIAELPGIATPSQRLSPSRTRT